MKLCPKCGESLDKVIEGYMCLDCGKLFGEDEVITPRCPTCNEELDDLDFEYYCYTCGYGVSKEDAVLSQDVDFDYDDDFEEPNYDSMIGNGDGICLNCTYWSVSPYGAAHGMVCRRNYPTSGPGDSCSDFVQSHHFASYGDNGQYQFDETRRDTANKLYHWRNNR